VLDVLFKLHPAGMSAFAKSMASRSGPREVPGSDVVVETTVEETVVLCAAVVGVVEAGIAVVETDVPFDARVPPVEQAASAIATTATTTTCVPTRTVRTDPKSTLLSWGPQTIGRIPIKHE
jgi:hypothetical protein